MRLFREKAGVISAGPVWVFVDGEWLYVGSSLVGLIWVVVFEWRSDDHLVG